MKLVECHIAGFGGFSDFRITFDDGLNVVLQPNGWGKTTLAAYIKAMLYGLDRKRIRNVAENERLRYLPWNNGPYGGTLDFEWQGTTYRVARTFGETPAGDRMKLHNLDSGEKVEIPEGDLGEWIFGLDAGSFQKSVFVNQSGFGFNGSNNGLRTRLNAVVGASDDTFDVEKALQLLDEGRKYYKKLGNRGHIADTSNELTAVLGKLTEEEQRLDQARLCASEAWQLEEKNLKLADRVKKERQSLKQAQEGEADTKALLRVHEQLQERLASANEALSTAQNQYRALPTPDTLARIRETFQTLSLLESQVSQAEEQLAQASLESEQQALSFGRDIPSKDQIEEKRRELLELSRLRDLEAMAFAHDADKDDAASQALAANPSLANEATRALRHWQVLGPKLAELEGKRRQLQAADASWGAARDQTLLLLEEANRQGAGEGEDTSGRVAALRKAATTLEGLADQAAALSGAKPPSRSKKKSQDEPDSEKDAPSSRAKNSRGISGASVACLALAMLSILAGIATIVIVGVKPLALGCCALAAVLFVVAALVLTVRPKNTGEPASAETAPPLADAGLEDTAQALEAINVQAAHTLASVGLTAGQSIASDAQAVRQLADRLEAEDENHDALWNQALTPLARALGKDAATLTVDDIERLDSPHAPGTESLRHEVNALEKATAELTGTMDGLLEALGSVPAGNLALGAERLSQAMSGYEAFVRSRDAAASQADDAHLRAQALDQSLDGWAMSLGLGGAGALSLEVLDRLASNADAAERLSWQVETAATALVDATAKRDEARRRVVELVEPYGLSVNGHLPAALSALEQRSEELNALKAQAEAAARSLEAWQHDHEALLSGASTQSQVDTALEQMHLDAIQEEREKSLASQSQTEERARALYRSLDSYGDDQQAVAVLSQRKQEASADLNLIHATVARLEQARDTLDKRYLGSLTARFEDYASTLLKADNLHVAIMGDFEVSVVEDGVAHRVEGYSAGYQDLFDLCFRMALVDTLFEGEQPFLILDDPFATLDAKKLDRAVGFLQLMAERRQIVYFTCHPSRTLEAGEGAKVKFKLPALKPAKETPRQRASREAAQRAEAQAQLVASYHVVPVTKGRASLAVDEAESKVISSNLYSVGFVPDYSRGSRDNTFDVHFIDGQGRAISEKQQVEVVEGRVVPERVRFSLMTRDDAGDVFDLVIHEQDRDVSELALRVPYKSEIAFSVGDLGF